MTRLVEFTDRAVTEKEAAAWVAKLDGGALSREELKGLRRWALQSPVHRSALEEMAASWDMLDVLAVARPARRFPHGFGQQWRGLGVALAAGVAVLAIVIGVIVMQPGRESDPADLVNLTYFTAIGEQRSVTLPDGTDIRINTNSGLQVEYTEAQRGVVLHRGEAFFDVASSDRPFVVTAGKGRVTALGTAFAVRVSENNLVEVDVTQGTVIVTAGSNRVISGAPPADDPFHIVSAGQVAVVGESVESVQTVEPGILERQLAWREGMLVFDGDSLENVIAEVSRYTPVEIVMADPPLRSLKIGGYFRIGDTEALLETLSSSFDIEAEHIRPGLIYLRRAQR